MLHFVIKTLASDEISLKFGSRKFTAEERFYSSIIPAIKTFEKLVNVSESEGIDVFIPCIGSRISLNPGIKDLNIILIQKHLIIN